MSAKFHAGIIKCTIFPLSNSTIWTNKTFCTPGTTGNDTAGSVNQPYYNIHNRNRDADKYIVEADKRSSTLVQSLLIQHNRVKVSLKKLQGAGEYTVDVMSDERRLQGLVT